MIATTNQAEFHARLEAAGIRRRSTKDHGESHRVRHDEYERAKRHVIQPIVDTWVTFDQDRYDMMIRWITAWLRI